MQKEKNTKNVSNNGAQQNKFAATVSVTMDLVGAPHVKYTY